MRIKELKKGDYFTLIPITEPNDNQVYIRGEFDRQSKSYSCTRFSDVNAERFYNGNKIIFTEFTF